LDTNVISELTKPKPSPSVVAWLNRQSRDALYITTVTVAEIGAGVSKLDHGKRRADLEKRHEEFLDLFGGRILSFDLSAAMMFGRTIGDARAKGIAISFQDGLIASIARMQQSACVATRDVLPFTEANIEVINPWDADEVTGEIVPPEGKG
jgi:predicted nucleic acid-binding protein